MYARIENDQIAEYPVKDIKSRFPNASFPKDLTQDENLPSGWVYVGTATVPDHNPNTHRLQLSTEPTKINNRWYVEWILEEIPQQEQINLEIEQLNQAEMIRQERNRLLSESDWTQLSDAPVDRAAWASYRQSLRDITKQPNFPQVEWPIDPNN